jgi:hypothetical protein
VTKIRSFQKIGVAPPGPGKAVRQTTFSVLLHFSGTSFSRLTPSCRGPRHCGQFSAAAPEVTAISTSKTRPTVRWQLCNLDMGGSLYST